jgi:hypothetical protein
VADVASPPAAETRDSGARFSDAKMMLPSSPHDPPRGFFASQMTTGDPPSTEIFLSLPPAKKAIDRLSGEKNGDAASSVPARTFA